MGGTFIALDALGIPFEGVAAETEWHLRELTRRRFPWLQMWSDCMSLCPKAIVRGATQASCDTVLLAGGPPCQPLFEPWQAGSLQGRARGPIILLFKLRDQLRELCTEANLPFSGSWRR